MADLDPLIRYRKFELDEKQRQLATLFAEQETLESKKTNLLDQLQHEMQVAQDLGNIDALSAYTQYAEAVKVKIKTLNDHIEALRVKIDAAMDEIGDAFGDLKKVEITQERRLQEISKLNQKREDDFFSEVALQRYYKRMQDEDED